MAIIYMRNYNFYDIKDKQKPHYVTRTLASSPLRALKNVGYTDIKRTTKENAQIEVRGKRARYFYAGKNRRES